MADELLRGFSGYLQTYAYGGYNGTAARVDVTPVGCWAHARRKFDVAAKSASGPGARAQAQKALGFIRQLYAIERLIKGQSPEEKKAYRDQHSRPVLGQFRQWIDETLILAEVREGVLKTAYTYVINQWPKLLVYLEDGRLHIDNNHAERFNRPIAQDRKQWLFAQSEVGVHATAAWYSVIATAKANGWEPYHYLKELFTQLPQYLQDGKPLDDLMPWLMPKPAEVGGWG
ncbi:IS66 family transposase [Magnetovirga frankeli]|uniref:IS66 family transposase n=1 Tax=Magnetovirga frankeli TaxID=947516 RepID=UPI003D357EA8